MPKEPILIVCYTFPPEKGIGGKRWSKFAKYLNESNYEVHVVTRKLEPNRSITILDNYGLNGVKIHEIKDHYPKILQKRLDNLWHSFLYKVVRFVSQIRHNGSIYDRSIFMEKELQNKIKFLLETNDIKHVFVTCAPFYLALWVGRLKEKTDFNLIVDLRDPWTWGKSYGYENISNNRKKHDQIAEKEVMHLADLITSPSENIISHLQKTYPDISYKFKHLPHGIDITIDTLSFKKNKEIDSSKEFRCIYAGTLYDHYDIFLNKIMISLKILETSNPELFNDFKFDIYATNNFTKYQQLVKDFGLEKKINFFNPIDENDLFLKLSSYDLSIIYFPEKYKDFISTKFFELIYLKIPILFMGEEGVVSQFIMENNIGEFIENNLIEEKFAPIIEKIKESEYLMKIEIEAYKFENLTKQLIRLANSIN